MVRLKNIRINGKTIECDIYPEDSSQAGHVVVYTDTKTLKSYTLPDGYEWCMKHVAHVKNKLTEFIGSDTLPAEKVVMWC